MPAPPKVVPPMAPKAAPSTAAPPTPPLTVNTIVVNAQAATVAGARVSFIEQRIRSATDALKTAEAAVVAAQLVQSGSLSLSARQACLDESVEQQRDAQAAWNKTLGLNVGPSPKVREATKRALAIANERAAAARRACDDFRHGENRLTKLKAAQASAEATLAAISSQVPSTADVSAHIAAAAGKIAARHVEASIVKVLASALARDEAAARVTNARARVSEKRGERAMRRYKAALARAELISERANKLLLKVEGELAAARESLRTAGQDAHKALAATAPFADVRRLAPLLVTLLASVLPTSASGDARLSACAALGDLRSLATRLNPKSPVLRWLPVRDRGHRNWFLRSSRCRLLTHALNRSENLRTMASASAASAPTAGTTAEPDGKSRFTGDCVMFN
jgi:hypothetical protein